MLFVMMALFGSVTVNEVSLDASILENMQDEWIAPGYRVQEEIIIDPLDYGVPQDDRDGNPRVIGFQSFFVQTPEGEKWRIVLTYDRKVVVLQEDAESLEFEVERSIQYMINSKDGRFVLLRLQEEEDTRTQYEIAISGIYHLPPEKRAVLIDTDSGMQIARNDIEWITYIASDGYMIGLNNDSIRFYDNNMNIINSSHNWIRQLSSIPTAYATDGSIMVRLHAETVDEYEEGIGSLRAYDRYGNVLWDSYIPNTGWPAVSDNGDFVLVLGWSRLMCLDGRNGVLLWDVPLDNEGSCFNSSRNGSACSFFTDVTQEEVRENPSRARSLYVASTNSDGNGQTIRITFSSDKINFFFPSMINATGCSVWNKFTSERGESLGSSYELCMFSEVGELLFLRRIVEQNHIANGHWSNLWNDLHANSIDLSGRRMIWFDKSSIHIVSIGSKGVSE